MLDKIKARERAYVDQIKDLTFQIASLEERIESLRRAKHETQGALQELRLSKADMEAVLAIQSVQDTADSPAKEI